MLALNVDWKVCNVSVESFWELIFGLTVISHARARVGNTDCADKVLMSIRKHLYFSVSLIKISDLTRFSMPQKSVTSLI